MRQQIEGVDDQGPWIAAALFCDAVIEDEVGARTLVRLHQGGEFFDAQKATAYGEPVIFLSFVGGPRRGRFSVEVIGHLPGRLPQQVGVFDIAFDGPGSGHDVFGPVRIAADTEGIALFDVVIEGRILTQMAYRILHVSERRAVSDAVR